MTLKYVSLFTLVMWGGTVSAQTANAPASDPAATTVIPPSEMLITSMPGPVPDDGMTAEERAHLAELDRMSELSQIADTAQKVKSLSSGRADSIATTVLDTVAGDNEEMQNLSKRVKTARKIRKAATGDIGAIIGLLRSNMKTSQVRNLKPRTMIRRTAKTTGLKAKDFEISDMRQSGTRTVYKVSTDTQDSYWCFIDSDKNNTSEATCSKNGGEMCNPTRRKASEC